MAEAAGLVFAVLGAFNDTIQCFDYVHIARNFDRDSKTAILNLDVAKLRLSRWGRSVGIDKVEEKTTTLPGVTATPEELKKAKELLENIQELFVDAESKSAKLRPKADAGEAGSGAADVDAGTQSLRQGLAKLTLKNFSPKELLKKTKWGIYSEKHVRRLIEDITEQVNALVDLFPAAKPAQQELTQEEGRELASEGNVKDLEPILAEQDPELKDAIRASNKGSTQIFNTSFEGSTNYGLQQALNSGNQTFNFGFRPNDR